MKNFLRYMLWSAMLFGVIAYLSPLSVEAAPIYDFVSEGDGSVTQSYDDAFDYSWHDRARIAVAEAGIIPFLGSVIIYLLIAIVICFLFSGYFRLGRWCLFLVGLIGLTETILFLMPGAGDMMRDFVNMILLFGLQFAATLFFAGRRDSVLHEPAMIMSYLGMIVGFVVLVVEMFKGSFFMNLLSTIIGLAGVAFVVWIVYVMFFRSSSDSYSPYRSGNDEDRDWDSGSFSGGSGSSAGDRYRRQDRGQTVRGGSRCCANCQHRTARGYCDLSDVPVSRLDVCAQFRSKWLD